MNRHTRRSNTYKLEQLFPEQRPTGKSAHKHTKTRIEPRDDMSTDHLIVAKLQKAEAKRERKRTKRNPV